MNTLIKIMVMLKTVNIQINTILLQKRVGGKRSMKIKGMMIINFYKKISMHLHHPSLRMVSISLLSVGSHLALPTGQNRQTVTSR